jgi:plasmid stabilization system protein ParE
MNVRISIRAGEDLDFIYAIIHSRQGDIAADNFIRNAIQATEFIAKNPEAGPHPRWVTRHKTLRFWVISRTNYLIFYFVDETGVSIERVLDGRRDIKRIIEERLENPTDEN